MVSFALLESEAYSAVGFGRRGIRREEDRAGRNHGAGGFRRGGIPQTRERGLRGCRGERARAFWRARGSALGRGDGCGDGYRRHTDVEGGGWGTLGADLCVMAFVTEIIPHEVLEMPRLGTIQYHPSLLPLHRGSSAINWAIIFGRKETGLTVFWPDRGIDTGPILLQKACPIGPDDTVGSLYFERLFPMGVDAMAEAAALV
ncbi:MAG: hypothetical protein C4321_04765, partial [Chloroflexota bacterium]